MNWDSVPYKDLPFEEKLKLLGTYGNPYVATLPEWQPTDSGEAERKFMRQMDMRALQSAIDNCEIDPDRMYIYKNGVW